MKHIVHLFAVLLLALTAPLAPLRGADAAAATSNRIDRQSLVARHNVTLTHPGRQMLLQVGNGEFAFGVDVTGLQTFAGNTMSHWGWHSFLPPAGRRIEDLRCETFDTYGRSVGYATSSKGQEALFNWLRENPHRLNLGRLGLRLTKADGTLARIDDLKNIHQELDLWSGLIVSRYEIEGQAVRVETCCHPMRDAVAVRIESPLIAAGRLAVELAFPYGSPGASGADWNKPAAHQTTMKRADADRVARADFARQLDGDAYAVSLAWADRAELIESSPHHFTLTPARDVGALEFLCAFALKADASKLPSFAEVKAASAEHWPAFWQSGGAIDLSASRDPRWRELERRIVLSQYLLAVQESGSLPPQESGLFNNGWNGKFHLEMHWWHGAHYALWDRWPLFQRSLDWYRQTLPAARRLAASQGYAGARWPKMVGPDGRDSPSAVGPLLIWQQPHPIFYASLDDRLHPGRQTLERWRDVVFDTADFLASFAVFDKTAGCYVLGPPIKTVPENTNPRATRNPTFELSYWRFGLRTAQEWRQRLGMARSPEWDKVLNGLAPLPTKDGLYLQQEGMAETFTKMNWEHPSLIGPLGMLSGDGVDPATMHATAQKVMQDWRWDRCWGWDFPMMAMAAARTGQPALAVDALLNPSPKNGFDAAGLSTGGPYPYFPSNGGLLYAVAMMAAGWDGAPTRPSPGFPDDGSWVVKWEGLKKAP